MRSVARRRRSIASSAAVAVLAGVPVTLAVWHDGFPVTDVRLETRDVWVTNGDALLAGRLNRPIEELDGAVSGESAALDVLQDGSTAFLVDADLGRLARIDPAYTTLVEPAEIPPRSQLAFGEDTLAIVSPRGELWAIDVANGLAFDAATAPAAELGAGAVAAVTPSGTVLAVSPDRDELVRIVRPGASPEVEPFDVPDAIDFAAIDFAAIGEQPVVFDRESGRVILPGRTVELPDGVVRLQQSGPAHPEVVLATGDALVFVALDSGAVRTVPARIEVAVADPAAVSAPVQVAGCAHGAWAGAQRYLLACPGEPADARDIQQRTQGSRVEFRVNRTVVALNDLTTGNVWLLDATMRLVDDWAEVTPPDEEETDDGGETASTRSFEDTLAERTELNRPPVARDDEFGARPGRTTIIPVLENDTDPDGDVLTIHRFTDLPESAGRLDAIDGGRALQYTPAPGATSASFRYSVDDGRAGGIAEAAVTIRVVPEEENAPPVARRETAVGVETGGTIHSDVLGDWTDPDGDDVYLATASATSSDVVRSTPDGRITFEHASGEPGAKEVHYTVSDGRTTSPGVLVVHVEPAGSLPPVGTPDFATTFVGEPVAIEPLRNDLAPNGHPLVLLGVDDTPLDATVIANPERGTITFQAPRAGSFAFLYQLSAGPASSVGLIRVDVLEGSGDALPPVAVKDTGYLRPGEPTVVDVLANDVSPDGAVLAVQSVDTDGTAAELSVEILGNAVVRITASTALTHQTQFRYTISDGVATATAGVTVVPVPPIVNRQPPIALDDRVRVRAGDVVNADVLANDVHPDQAQLRLAPDLVDTSAAGDGLAFVGDGMVRYQAGSEPGEFSVVYRVLDQHGESATARVTFVVVGPDPESNRAPVPLPQTARVFAGATVPIEVPLDGIDPDGDSVVLVDLAQPPTRGTVEIGRGSTWIEYTADADGGTDTFGYLVEDAWGARAVGVITVGVIPRPEAGQPPNAVDDAVELRPGRTATVPVLHNDSDPGGSPLRLDDELREVDPGITAIVEGASIVVEAPDEPGAFTIRYAISNGRGGVDTAFLQVTVTDDAEPLPPRAEDRSVPLEDVVGVAEVPVPLDGLIANPGGRTEDLEVTVEGPNAHLATVDRATQTITVRPGPRRTAIAYRVANPDDGLSATAFLFVPPEASDGTAPPRLVDGLEPQIVDMDGEREWDLADLVVVPSGRAPVLDDGVTVTATHADGSPLVVDDDTIRFAPAPGYRGTAAITFRVTDGSSGADPDGTAATLTLPLIVGDPDFEDTAPQFVTQQVRIEAGEAATVVDLRASTTHPNPALVERFGYSGLVGGTAEIEATLGGSELRLAAPLGVQPGARAELEFTVTFGDFEVPGRVVATVVSSSRPLAQAVPDAAKGRRNVTDTVDVLANDFNPFAAEGGALRLTDAVIENAAESAADIAFTSSGDITIEPGPAFIGVVSVVYTVEDATRDPNRVVQGRLQYTVRDVPGKVARPAFVEGDRQVTVEWDTPASNGEPIASYTISWTGGSPVTVPGTAASHTFTGLANGTGYAFQVRAANAVGAGELSDPSAQARPYGAPFPVTSATASATDDGSGGVVLNWAGASGNGRSITGYRITMSPGGAQLEVGEVSQATFDGTVGTSYTYSIVALGPGGESAPFAATNSATPRPGAPGSATADWPGPRGTRTVHFAWTAAPSDQPITRYEVLVAGVHSSWQDVGLATSTSITGSFDTPYSIQVRAVSAGQVGPVRTSNTATPLPQLPPSYSLCYHQQYGDAYNIGVVYRNSQPGRSVRTDIGANAETTTKVDGTVRLQAWAARTTSSDLGRQITILVDGSAVGTHRWGDAPVCTDPLE